MSHEKLSAMLDGECSDEEIRMLLDSEEDSQALLEKWGRLCLARDLISGRSASPVVSTDFCASVMARLGEPVSTVVVPFPAQATRAAPIAASPAIVRRPSRFRRDVARPLVGLAAAASLAFVAVATGRSFFGHFESPQDVAAVQPAPLPALGAQSATDNTARLVPVSDRVAATDEPAEMGWSQLNPDQVRELNGYLAQHNGLGADQGLGGPLGAGRMAVRTVEYRAAADGSR